MLDHNSRLQSETFKTIDNAAELNADDNSCSVKAVAVVTGCSYTKAYTFMRDAGRVHNEGASLDECIQGLKNAGAHKIKSVDIFKGCKNAEELESAAKSRGKYFLCVHMTGGYHAVAIKAKTVHCFLRGLTGGQSLKVIAAYKISNAN